MIAIRKLSELPPQERKNLIYRSSLNLEGVVKNTIEPLAEDFGKNAYAALQSAANRFDTFFPEKPVLERNDMKAAFDRINQSNPEIIEAFQQAMNNIQEFHEKQKPEGYETDISGNKLGFRFQPFDSAALYVPGGKALYPSTVLMGILPAKIAGVKDLVLLSPPLKETGNVHDTVQAIAYLAGADKILQAGGAQAVLAAAMGIPELGIKPVDFIYGPGNIFVAAAKTFVFSKNLCGIDSFAGPSEVLIIADKTANPHYLAHDLLAQAEHDEDAISVLLVNDETTAEETAKAIEHAIENRNEDEKRKQITRESIKNNGQILITDSVEDAVEFSNEFAPEHLEIQTANHREVLDQITAAGSIFTGDYSPVAAGDYYTGTNHILPTGRAARFSSGVSVHSFFRRITYQTVSREGLQKSVQPITVMSKVENLFSEHGYSVLARFEES